MTDRRRQSGVMARRSAASLFVPARMRLPSGRKMAVRCIGCRSALRLASQCTATASAPLCVSPQRTERDAEGHKPALGQKASPLPRKRLRGRGLLACFGSAVRWVLSVLLLLEHWPAAMWWAAAPLHLDGWQGGAEDAEGSAVLVDADLSAAVAHPGFAVIDAAELPRCDALDGLVAMDVVAFLVERDGARHEVIYVAYLELDG